MTQHSDHRFSITMQSDDLAVVGCMRALAKFSQATGNNNIPWGGTKDADWRKSDGNVTFRLSTPGYHDRFRSECDRLLRGDWAEARRSDADPAQPQS